MRSLWTIAELAWRQLNPPGKTGSRNTIEEYVESAKDLYAQLAFQTYLEAKQDADVSVVENLLRHKKYEVLEDEEGKYSELEVTVMDLPRDMGVFQVRPPGQRPLVKTTLVSQNLYGQDVGAERTYYRINKAIRFPDGFEKPLTTFVWITTASLEGLDATDAGVPDIFAHRIHEALVNLYGETARVPADDTNNKNPNR